MTTTSVFTYPVTRQYPAKFTLIILAGGAILTTLFTFVAFAGNAYQLETYYTNDYNSTIANISWYQRQAFSWATDTNMQTTCQPVLLTTGGDHITTNQGFHYAIASLRHEGDRSIPLTVSYRNGSLNDCQVREIVIELARNNENRLPRNFWSWGSSSARSTTECRMDTDDGPYRVDFTSQLPTINRRIGFTDGFLALNSTAHPARYIDVRIFQSWYTQLGTAMGYSAPGDLQDGTASWGFGSVTLTRSDVMDFKSLDFFYIDTSFSDDEGGLSWLHLNHTVQHWHDQWTPKAKADRYNAQLPNISLVVDAFAKTYYSLLLSDFNSSEEVKLTNALSTGEGLEYLQSVNNTDLADTKAIFSDTSGGIIGRVIHDNTNLTQPLEFAEHTTLYSSYLCSIPKRKNTFKVIFAVILADIVFLGACWRVFGWVATWWLGRTDPSTGHCSGCINATHDLPLALIPGSVGGGSYSQVSSEAGDEHRGNQGRLSAPKIARSHSGV